MQPPISPQRLSELIGLIYDAAIDPVRWPVAMDAIRIELDFHNATLNLQQLPSGKLLTNVTCNIAPHYLAMMEGAGPDVIEQWGGAELAQSIPLDQPAVLTRVNPRFDASTSVNPYFLAFAKPQRIIDVLAIGLARDARGIGTLSFGRHEAAGPISEREISIAQLLVPHLQRAATINRMLDAAVIAQATFQAGFDTLPLPVLFVDQARGVVYANPSARRMIEHGDPVRVVNGMLDIRSAGASKALDVALVHAAKDESTIARRGQGVPLQSEAGTAGALHVLPLRRGRLGAESGAVAAIFVALADTPFVAPTEIIRALFDLTPAQAKVFDLIATGQTVKDAAASLSVEPSTVKTHLLRIYEKVGVRRQSALMQIAASLSLPGIVGG